MEHLKTPSSWSLTLAIALAFLLSAATSAKEVPRLLYSRPVGLTEAEGFRVVIAPLPARLQVSPAFCQAEVTVEILDAMTMQSLKLVEGVPIGPGTSLEADYQAVVGPPPNRQEVVVRVAIERVPAKQAERGSLAEICPLVASWQLFDLTTGRTLDTSDGDDDQWELGSSGSLNIECE